MLVSPVILVALAVSLFFFPNILSYSLIEPAMNSIYPTLLDSHEKFHVHISQWHGLNTEVLMTAGIIVIGTIGYLSLNKWKGIYKLFPSKLTLNRLYDKLVTLMEKGSYRITKQYMTGF